MPNGPESALRFKTHNVIHVCKLQESLNKNTVSLPEHNKRVVCAESCSQFAAASAKPEHNICTTI